MLNYTVDLAVAQFLKQKQGSVLRDAKSWCCLQLVIAVSNLFVSLKGKLGEIFLSAQSFYPTLTKRSFNRQF